MRRYAVTNKPRPRGGNMAGERLMAPRGTQGALLLTGATGFVGMEVLARYLERTDRRIYPPVRAGDAAQAEQRLRSALRLILGRGDTYTGGITAASVSFSLPLPRAREINVAGTRRLLELAEHCRDRGGLRRFSYVSTAYVAGTHAGEFREDQLEVGQDFRNAYERSKFEAEQLVRSYRDRLPIQIFRPSIVVGERATGWTAAFNVLYAPLKAFARGAYTALPAPRSSPVDVVPVDYVADAVFELFHRPMGDE